MRAAAVALAATLACACTPADPAVHAERQWRTCMQSAVPQERLHACTTVIAASDVDPARRAAALVERGVQRVELGQHLRAVADFGRALRVDPTAARAYLERGDLHYDRGAYQAALADYDAALALEPNMQHAALRREAALRGLADANASQIDLVTRALTENPRSAALWNERCWIRAVSGEDLDYALADCNESLRLDPDYAAALDSRGLVHIKRGEFAEAIADYEAALAVEPDRGHYLYGRGLARISLGREAEGRADLIAAEAAEPGVADLYRHYGVGP